MAIIPARAGSKGLANKNIIPLCGKPLIVWTIEQALACGKIDTVVVSTDSEEIRQIALAAGAEAPFLRPPSLAGDESPTFLTAVHALDFYEAELKRKFDYVLLLEPTSPLRRGEDLPLLIRTAMECRRRFDAAITLGPTPGHPAIHKRTEKRRVLAYFEGSTAGRRQDLEPAWFPFGVGYIVKSTTLRQEKTFYPNRTTFTKIDRAQCYEIDDIYDFVAVEAIMKLEQRR
jgi:CMP-N,N'-diacetyllegionaminic acid synthase